MPRFLAHAALAGLVAIAVTGAPVQAQDQLPVVEVRQVMNDGAFAFAALGRLRLDRDAFLVVFELGADNRARVLYPTRPRDNGFTRANRPVYVPLPSADAAFIRAAELSLPHIIAFASDVAPDLSEFTRDERRWDYQYAVSGYQPVEHTARELATLIFGSPDMPYSVGIRSLSPLLPMTARRQLASCGYLSGSGMMSVDFNRFLWDLWGPVSLLETSWNIQQRYTDWQWSGVGQSVQFPWAMFGRMTSPFLWNRYGAGCGALQPFRPFIAMGPVPGDGTIGGTLPNPEPEEPSGKLPADRELRPPGTVTDVGIVPVTPEAMERRAGLVGQRTVARTEAREALQARGPLTRESNQELVRRQEIQTTIALLTAQRAAGRDLSVADVFARVRAGQVDFGGATAANGRSTRTTAATRYPSGGSGGFGGSGAVTRTSPMGGASGGGGGGSGSSGGSVGSAGSSGGSEARGGGAASARGSTGRP